MRPFSYTEWTGGSKTAMEQKMLEIMDYNDIFVVTVYCHADVRWEIEARDVWIKYKKLFPELKNFENFCDQLPWRHIYNISFEKMLEGRKTYIDVYGAYGFKDSEDNSVFGDSINLYPLMDKESLAKRL